MTSDANLQLKSAAHRASTGRIYTTYLHDMYLSQRRRGKIEVFARKKLGLVCSRIESAAYWRHNNGSITSERPTSYPASPPRPVQLEGHRATGGHSLRSYRLTPPPERQLRGDPGGQLVQRARFLLTAFAREPVSLTLGRRFSYPWLTSTAYRSHIHLIR